MTEQSIRTVLISTDRSFREVVREVFLSQEGWTAPALEIVVPFGAFGEDQIRGVRQARPDLIILDLSDDPDLGIRFAQFLCESTPGLRFLAVGPLLAPELLLNAMRAGVSDYLPKPVSADAFRSAIERVRHLLGVGPGDKAKQPGHLYAFYSAKGGSGSTTVATNLAIVLHRATGKKTLLVDLDLELGEIALLLGVQPRFNFVDMVQNFHRMDADLLASYIERHQSGVHLLSAPYHPEKAEVVTGDQIRRILHFLRKHYDYVVVDTSKSFSPATLAAFEQAELAFLVTNVDLASLRNIQRGLPLLKRMMGRNEGHIRLVVNRYDGDNDISLNDVRRTLGLEVFWTLCNDYQGVSRSINTGTPIVLNGKSRYSQDLKGMGLAIAGIKADRWHKGRLSAIIRPVSRLWRRILRRPEEVTPL